MNLLDYTVVLGLGLLAGYHSAQLGSRMEYGPPAYSSCEEFIKSTKLPEGLRLSTKIPYSFSVLVRDESKLGDCAATAMYTILRHGTRYPSPKYISKWSTLEQQLRDHVHVMNSETSQSTVGSLIQSWTNPFSFHPGELTLNGMWEQFCLAKRYQRRFSSLLKENMTYTFRATQTPRTVKSALSFAHGLFSGEGTLPGRYEPIFLESASLSNDTLLRFFDKDCPLYNKQVENNESLSAMFQSYWDSEEIDNVLKHVQELFNQDGSTWTLSLKDVMTIYRLCLHETGVFGSSHWCHLFSEEDQRVLEYYLDLKTYWKRGLGFAVNWQRVYPLVTDILSFLRGHTNQHGNTPILSNRIVFRFAHAETIIPLLIYFGFFNDSQPLLATNYNEMRRRLFRAAEMAPYSANIAFVLYQCRETFRVRIIVNEKEKTPFTCARESQNEELQATLCTIQELEELMHIRGSNNWTLICS